MQDLIRVRFYCGRFFEDFIYPEDTSSLELSADLDVWVSEFGPQDIECVGDIDTGWQIEEYIDRQEYFDYDEDELLDDLFMSGRH